MSDYEGVELPDGLMDLIGHAVTMTLEIEGNFLLTLRGVIIEKALAGRLRAMDVADLEWDEAKERWRWPDGIDLEFANGQGAFYLPLHNVLGGDQLIADGEDRSQTWALPNGIVTFEWSAEDAG